MRLLLSFFCIHHKRRGRAVSNALLTKNALPCTIKKALNQESGAVHIISSMRRNYL